MSTYTATFTNPEYNYSGGAPGVSETVPCAILEFGQEFGVISYCRILVLTDIVSKYSLETTDANPCQKNSVVEIKRDSDTWFYGYVFKKPRIREGRNNYLEVEINGCEGVLARTFCNYGDAQEWTMETSPYALTQLPLQSCSVYGSFQGDTLWADPGDATGAKCYIEDASSNSDQLRYEIGDGTYAITALNQGNKTFDIAENVPDEFAADDIFEISGSTGNDGNYTIVSATWTGAVTRITVSEAIPNAVADGNIINHTIILKDTYQAFSPRGWVKIDSEWIYYDGYDNANTDGDYRLRGVERGQLGTAAATHVVNSVTYNKVAKAIAPRPILLELDTGGGYEALRYGQDYSIVASLGCFVLSGSDAGDYRASYSVYDSDQSLDATSTVITAENVIARFITASNDYGGAGFSAGDYTLDSTGLYITRYDYDLNEKAPYAWQAIHDFLLEISLEDQYRFWFNHGLKKFRFGKISKAGSPSMTISGANRVEMEDSLEATYSCVRIAYTDDQVINRVNPDTSRHQASTGVTTSPDLYRRTTAGGSSWHEGTNTTDVAAGNFGVDMLIDGKDETKLSAEYDHDPTDEIDFCHFWFDTTSPNPDPIRLNEIFISFNAYRVIEGWNRTTYRSDYNYVLRIDGCDDYDITTYTGTWVPLGCTAYGVPGAESPSKSATFTEFALQNVNAIRIVFEYMAGPKQSGDYYYATIHELKIAGDITKYVIVQTSDTVQDNPLYLYAPDSHKKLRYGLDSSAGVEGCPRSLDYPIGGSSEGAAITIGRALLLTKLAQYQQRFYVLRGNLATKPELGDTIGFDETGDGVSNQDGILLGLTCHIENRETVWTFRIWDPDASVIS